MGRLILLVTLLYVYSAAAADNSFVDRWNNLWWTPEQQGQRLLEKGDYVKAAKRSQNPMLIGNALYRAGEFEDAAMAFGRVNSPQGAFNQGTAMILLGQYEPAILAFDRALAAKPDWLPAIENRAIAEARLSSMQNQEVQMASEVGADDIVFSDKKSKSGDQVEDSTQQGAPLSEQALRALWLKKSQTSPAVFLRAKFAAQFANQNSTEPEQ